MGESGSSVKEVTRYCLDRYQFAGLFLDSTAHGSQCERFFERLLHSLKQDDEVVIGIRAEIAARPGSVEENPLQTIAVPGGELLFDDRNYRVIR